MGFVGYELHAGLMIFEYVPFRIPWLCRDRWKADSVRQFLRQARPTPLLCRTPALTVRSWRHTVVHAYRTVWQVLLGLSFMHRHHTPHLDLKPDNIMSKLNIMGGPLTKAASWVQGGDLPGGGRRLPDGTIKLIDTTGVGQRDTRSFK